MSEFPPKRQERNLRPPILHWFVIERLPEGTAPDEIKRAWIGTPLPMRTARNMDGPDPKFGVEVDGSAAMTVPDGITIFGGDALHSLRLFGHVAAAMWWHNNIFGALIFNAHEGKIINIREAEGLFPEIRDYDGDS